MPKRLGVLILILHSFLSLYVVCAGLQQRHSQLKNTLHHMTDKWLSQCLDLDPSRQCLGASMASMCRARSSHGSIVTRSHVFFAAVRRPLTGKKKLNRAVECESKEEARIAVLPVVGS